MAAAAPAVASPQELVEREAAEALANDFWERIVSRALDVRQETSSSSSSSSLSSSSSGSPLRSLPMKEFCTTLLWLVHQRCPTQADDEEDEDADVQVLDHWMLSVVLSDRGESEPDRPHVSKSLFLLFLLRFGPLEHCLDKVRDALEHGKIWFHGNQPRDPSERLLEENIKDGLFLVRYSSSPGHFTVDYIKNGKMYHFNSIRNNFAGPGVIVNIKLDSDKMKEFRYSSLSSFVVKNKHLYTEPCLNQRSHFYWAKLAIPPRGSIISVDARRREQIVLQRVKEKTAQASTTPSPAVSADAVKAAVSERVKTSFESDNRAELLLRDMGIGPDLPTQIGVLTYLRVIDLSGNAIKRVSLNLSALHDLEALSLSDNELTQLPGSLFSSLPSLRRFECSDNLLTQLPQELFGSVTLNYLDFSNNRLEDLPLKVSRLEQLQFLDLSGNELRVLPDTIGLLKQLEEFNVRDNSITKLPTSVSQLHSLNIFNLENNKLTDIDNNLFNLLDTNPYLEVLAEGNPLKNPLAIQQWKEKKTRRDQQNLRTATNRISVDIFSLLKMHSKARSNESPSPRVRTRKCSIGATPFPIKPKSLWDANPESYWVEVGQGERPALDSLRLQEHVNLNDYCRFFYHQAVHANIIGLDKVLGPVCISIQKEPMSSDGGLVEGDMLTRAKAMASPRQQGKSLSYRVLVRTRQGDRRLMIPAGLIRVRRREHYARSDDLLAGLRQLTKPMFSATKLRVIRDPASHPKFAELEEKLITNSYKFGVIYALEGQDETAMYNNAHASPAFEAFMSLLGDRVCMKGWQKYTGGLSTSNAALHSYYTTHEGMEIMFHVSTELPLQARTDELGQQWERKRFLGNDIVMLVFYEGQSMVDPATFLSNFNHSFALVQPQLVDGEVRYKLEMCYKRGVAESIPHLPLDPVFEHSNYFREFLITKLINAERCSLSAPQFRRAQERVREELFTELLEQFPKQQKKKKDSRKDVAPACYYVDPQMAQMLLKMAKGEK